MTRFTAMALGLAVATAAHAADVESLTAYLRKSTTPVTVPGGATTFVLDPTAPAGSPPVSEQISVVKKTSAAFPTFILPPFTEDSVLPIKIGATVHLSANLSLGGCGQMDAQILQIDPLGGETVAATVGLAAQTIPQGGMNGTVGFASFRLTSPGISCMLLDGIPVSEGGSIGLRVVVTNDCNANRTVALAYDGADAPGEVDFVEPTEEEDEALRLACQQKCGTGKLKAAGKKTVDRSKCFEKAVQKSLPVDPACLDKASLKMFADFQREEAKGGCVFTGDYPAVEGVIDSAIGAFVAALDPASTDVAAVKCAAAKLKAARTKAGAKIGCWAKAFRKGEAVDPACLGKADDKFLAAFAKAEAKGGCATSDDAAAVEAIVDGLVGGVVDLLVPDNPT